MAGDEQHQRTMFSPSRAAYPKNRVTSSGPESIPKCPVLRAKRSGPQARPTLQTFAQIWRKQPLPEAAVQLLTHARRA